MRVLGLVALAVIGVVLIAASLRPDVPRTRPDRTDAVRASDASAAAGQDAVIDSESPRPVEALIAALKVRSCFTQYPAAVELIRVGAPAVRPLVDLIVTTPPRDSRPPFDWGGWPTRAAAEYALRRIGPSGRAELEALLADPDPERVKIAARFLGEWGLMEPLLGLLETNPEAAVEGIGYLGPAGRAAIEPLLKLLHSDPKRHWRVMQTLRRLGAAKALAEVWALSPRHVALQLMALGPDAAPAVETLASLLCDPSTKFRSDLLRVLALIGPGARDALPVLVEQLEAGKLEAGRNVADTLVALGGGGEWVERGYLALIKNVKPPTREQVKHLIAASGGRTDEVVELLFLGLLEDYRRHPWPWLDAIAAVGEPVIPRLVKMAEDDDEKLRWLALRMLRDIGDPAVATLPIAERCLADPDPAVRRDALWTYVQLSHDPDRAVARIEPLLGDEDIEVRTHAARQIFRLTGDSERLLPFLESQLASTDREHGVMKSIAAAELGSIGKSAWPLVEMVLEGEDHLLWDYALEGLVDCTDLPESILVLARRHLRADDPDTRAAAAAVLLHNGEPREVFLDTLVLVSLPQQTHYKYDYTRPRVAALKTIASMGVSAEPALPVIESLLDSEYSDVREAARAALARLGQAD